MRPKPTGGASADPLIRIRILLDKAGGWTQEWQDDLETRASAAIEAAVESAEALPLPTVDEMFERMFAEPTGSLRQQQDEAGS